MRFLPLCSAAFLLASAVTAQTYTIRGKVEDVQGTANQFFLDGTVVSVFSNTLNLNVWQGTQAILDVVNTGSPGTPVLRIDAATATTKVMDMGNLRIGQSSSWEVFAPAGSIAFIFVGFTANTGFQPLPGFGGAWLLGSSPVGVTGGFTNPAGVFQTQVAMANVPGLIGTEISSQAVVGSPSNAWSFSNVDSKEVQN